MVIDFVTEKMFRLRQFTADVSPCGENELRLHVRSQVCSASPTQMPRKGEGVCTCCWNATDELLQKAATALVRHYAVAIYQHAVVGELTEAAQCRAALANLKFLEPHRPASLRREFEKVKDMRPLDLGTYIKGIYQSTQPIHLTEHGRAAKKFMFDKVFSSLAVRSATEVSYSSAKTLLMPTALTCTP